MKEVTKNWLEFCKRDLRAAEKLLDDEFCSNIVLFHCQQAVEKGLKAVLEEQHKDIPKIHNVLKLYDMLPDGIKNRLNISETDLNIIDEIYIDSRYPSNLGLLPDGFPSVKQAEEIYKITKKMVNGIISSIK